MRGRRPATGSGLRGRAPLPSPVSSPSAGASPSATPTAPPGQAGSARAAINAGDAWLLQLPTNSDGSGNVDEVAQPELATYSSEFYSDTEDGGVLLRTTADGETTSGSNYSRSELREMDDAATRSAWDTSSGRHVLNLRTAVLRLPDVKDQGSVAQVHGGDDDLVQIRLHGSDLRVHAHLEGASNDAYIESLDTDYQLGTPFDLSRATRRTSRPAPTSRPTPAPIRRRRPTRS